MFKGFYWLSKSWYRETTLAGTDLIDEIMIGIYDGQGGSNGEFAIRWQKSRYFKNKAIKIEIFNDAWHLLREFKYLFQALSELKEPEPNEIVELLKRLGFKDLTIKKQPRGLWWK